MGTWGTGLSSNDTFEDIYSEFIGMYNSGLEISEITNSILSDNVDLQNDYEDGQMGPFPDFAHYHPDSLFQ